VKLQQKSYKTVGLEGFELGSRFEKVWSNNNGEREKGRSNRSLQHCKLK